MVWYDHALNEFFGPNLGSVNACNAPKLDIEPSLVGRFTLSRIFILQVKQPYSSLMFYLMRRVDEAINAYNRMIELMTDWLPKKNSAPSGYYRVLTEAERCMAAVVQSIQMLKAIGEKKLFEERDGSPEQRAWDLHNFIKHVDERVREGKAPPNGTVACWITNDGLKCADHEVSFSEIAQMITGLHKCAESIFVVMQTKAAEIAAEAHPTQ